MELLINTVRDEPWFTKYQEGLDLWESFDKMTLQQYKKALALIYNNKPETEEFIKQFFIYGN